MFSSLIVAGLQHGEAVWARGPSADVAMQIEVETRIEFETIPVDVDDVELMVTFCSAQSSRAGLP